MKKLDNFEHSDIFQSLYFDYIEWHYSERLEAPFTRCNLYLVVVISRLYEGTTTLRIELWDIEALNRPVIYKKDLWDIDLIDLKAVEKLALKKCDEFWDFTLDRL